jgi:hypothetical protein
MTNQEPNLTVDPSHALENREECAPADQLQHHAVDVDQKASTENRSGMRRPKAARGL